MSSTYCAPCDDPQVSLDTIPVVSCRDAILQTQRVLFVRGGQIKADSNDNLNNIPATTSGENMENVAYWNILIAAADDTKVVTAPLFGGDTGIEAGTAITFGGGDNSTLNGITENRGVNPATFTGRYDNLDRQQVYTIRKLSCEGRLEVFLVNEQGKILVWEERDSSGALTGIYTGIPVSAFFLGSKTNTGFASKDGSILSVQFPANYDEHLKWISPADFNALTFNT